MTYDLSIPSGTVAAPCNIKAVDIGVTPRNIIKIGSIPKGLMVISFFKAASRVIPDKPHRGVDPGPRMPSGLLASGSRVTGLTPVPGMTRACVFLEFAL